MNAIEINGLSWKYSGRDDYALKDIHLTVEENTFLGIIGSNESGKTTLVSCIKGIIPENFSGVYKGEVKLFGKVVRECTSIELARMSGMVFSDPDSQFTSMSVEEEIAFGLENIGLSLQEIEERIEWVSKLTSIENLLMKPPYDLSGGQKQRVAIASVLAMKPRVIILDEPTSMLDPLSKDYIFTLLKKLKEELKITVIVIEHNIEKIAELADNILLMNNGKIERMEKAENFFDDIEFIERNSVKVPEAISFVSKIFHDRETIGKCPIKFDEIKTTLENYLKSR